MVFQCDRDKSAALLTAMTISQAAFLLVLGSIAWELKESATDTDDTDVNHATPDDIPEKAAPGPAINVFTKKDQGGERHYGFAALYGTLGCAFLSLGFFLPRWCGPCRLACPRPPIPHPGKLARRCIAPTRTPLACQVCHASAVHHPRPTRSLTPSFNHNIFRSALFAR